MSAMTASFLTSPNLIKLGESIHPQGCIHLRNEKRVSHQVDPYLMWDLYPNYFSNSIERVWP